MIKKFVKNKKILFSVITLLLIAVVCIISFTLSSDIENDLEVRPQSELIYYLNVSYDGVDKNGLESNDSSLSNINSGIIYVEDVLPEGLTFSGFVESEDGTFGAVSSLDETSVCPGYVVDDSVEGEDSTNNYHGLHYDPTSRKVYFKVKNLQAGCILTVGIKTATPAIDDPDTLEEETRRDFYNFATGRENDLTVNSNTIHVWMGEEKVELYTVSYRYDGVVPENAPAVPESTQYMAGDKVGVAPDVNLEGYDFSGWKTVNVEVNDNTFTMPDTNVVFVGSFTEKSKFKVNYRIEGDGPKEYVPPVTKEYYEGAYVTLDSMKAGTVYNGYRFLGWVIDDSDLTLIDKENFEMPNHDVNIVGKFTPVTYKVEYKFMGDNIPPDAENYLPDTQEYVAGVSVTLASVKDVPAGYEFLGWYYDDPFIMPEEDVVIYGEWRIKTGTFEPTITKKIIDPKDYYLPGDVVKYEIIVTNTAAFAIKDVIVKEENLKAEFNKGTGYEVSSPHVVTISTLGSNSSVTIDASYIVDESDNGTIRNTASIVGALADNNYYMNPEGSYEASAEFNVQAKLKICKAVDGVGTDRTFMINVSNANGFDTWVRLKKDECQTLYVKPDATYTITETIPQEYTLESIVRTNTKNERTTVMNGSSFVIEKGVNYEVTITNKFKKRGFFHSFGDVTNVVYGDKKDISQSDNISLVINNLVYNGSNQYAKPVIKTSDGVTLTEYKDYILEYTGDLKNVGTVSLRIIGIGRYMGEITREYKIEKAPLHITTCSASGRYTIFGHVTCSDVTIEGLQNGDKIKVTTNGSQRAIGKTDNTYEIDWLDTDPNNYEVTDTLGVLEVYI